MATNTIETVTDIFKSGVDIPPQELADTDMDADMADIKKRVEQDAGVKWGLSWDFLVGKLIDALGDKIPDIIGKAWAKFKEIQEYTDEEKYPPETPSLVPLFERTVTAEFQPHIEIKFKNVPLPMKINFDIELSLVIKGVNLQIQGGKIAGIRGGSCMGSGVIKWKGIKIVSKETPEFNLPGRFDFEKALAIPKPAR
jgi:hypothetical protein